MKFNCGCVIDKLDFDLIPLDCPATWDLINSGFTKGIFQLEGSLGKHWSKELKPRNIEELSDVISLIRPGCLEAAFREDDNNPGKFWSITETYKRVKQGDLEPEYIHECLKPIFESTYSVPIYQEQIMKICSDFAGFTLEEADVARKAVGKKKADVMAKVKAKFIEGALARGHDEELAQTIFGWIEKFSGYGFNKSHGVSYALVGYQTAYAKRHFPLQYFKSMLNHSDNKQDSMGEIQALVYEAKLFDITINPPCLKLQNTDFAIQDDKTIAFGLGHIKGVGDSSIKSIKRIAKIDDIRELLFSSFKKGKKVKKNVMEALIKSGALDYFGFKRQVLFAWYKILGGLTERELAALEEEFMPLANKSISKAVGLLLASKVVRGQKRKDKIADLVEETTKGLSGDKRRLYIGYEKFYLGISLSGSEVELYNNPRVDIKCRHLHKLPDGVKGNLGVIIQAVKSFKDKNGNWMCFMKVSDDTYMLERAVVFSSTYRHHSWIIEEGKPVLLTGQKDKDSFIVRKIDHL